MQNTIVRPSAVLCVLALAACAKAAPAAPTATAAPSPEPTATSAPAGITLTYGDNAQVELVTPEGRRIYIDVWNTSFLIMEPTADDILLTTHMHSDHYFSEFVGSFPGKKIVMAEGDIAYPDATVKAIVSAHLPADPLEAAKGTNFIFIIDTAGLRIVHFGDIGQEALTDGQLAAIGTVDLAVTQFSNSFSMMDAAGGKGFNLMDQVRPHLIIPTHYDKAALEIAAGRWAGFYSESRTVTIAPESLPAETGLLLLGAQNTVAAYAGLFDWGIWR
jgi:L-ascorbate metabolism protein UlaG (beta-lactamase superfamily)